MSNTKISALTASTIPLAGTEVLPIVQSSVTVKVSVDDLTVKNIRSNATNGILQISGPAAAATRVMTTPNANFTVARTDAAQSFTGNQTLSTGNLVIGTSGQGIDFSATPGTGTSELFSDYEEGTWTPAYTNWTINPTTNNATYTKVGRLVTITYVANDGVSVAGASEISGLPFTSKNTNGATVLMKDISGSSPGVFAIGAIAGAATKIGAMTSATFTGLYWAFSTTYVV